MKNYNQNNKVTEPKQNKLDYSNFIVRQRI